MLKPFALYGGTFIEKKVRRAKLKPRTPTHGGKPFSTQPSVPAGLLYCPLRVAASNSFCRACLLLFFRVCDVSVGVELGLYEPKLQAKYLAYYHGQWCATSFVPDGESKATRAGSAIDRR